MFSQIEPTLGAGEDDYRRHFFHTDKTHAKVSANIVLILAAAVTAVELSALPPELVSGVLMTRMSFFAAAFGVFLTFGRRNTPSALDRAALIFTVAYAAQFIALIVLRPATAADEGGMLVLVLAAYTLSPAPLAYRAVAPTILTIGALIAMSIARDATIVTMWPTILLLAAGNALGFWGSARMHTQRRRQYESQERLRISLQERDTLIDRLRQSNKMESMGRIVGGVTHDFNNILGSMFAALDFLLKSLPPDSPSRAEAESLKASANRGADLTKQLLAYSRQQVLEPRVVSLNDLVADTQRMLARTIGASITIDVSHAANLPAVRVDPGQIQQILLNLSVNARDAMPDGGTLRIQTKSLVLSEAAVMTHSIAQPGEYVTLIVSDTGAGMDTAVAAQIFEPFFTTKPKGKGTGLGLSTVFGIVEQSSGHIRVQSAPAKGTTFEIFLPSVSETPSAAAAEQTTTVIARGSETILLAEDDDDLRSLLGRVLSLNGYQVLEAEDGAHALRVAEDHNGPLHLLASDVEMPGMSGRRLADELTSRRPETRVLFMSGYAADSLAGGNLAPGDAFLQKPVDPTLLLLRIRSLLDGENRVVS